MTSAVGGYAFGDSAPAARRPGPLADLFEPTTRTFLERSPAGRSAWPSTSAAAPATPPACSPRSWVRDAPSASTSRSRSSPGRGPRPRPGSPSPSTTCGASRSRPAARPACCSAGFCSSHLTDPAAVLAAWATQLAPGGLLLVDEVERIHTADPALRGYLEVAGALLASRGQTLEVGPVLHRLADPPGLARGHDRVASLAPPVAGAAAMFGANLAVWGEQAVHDGVAGRRELDELASHLAVVAGGRRSATFTWELRQLAFQRA